jgi:hypothetical protein
MFKNKYNMNDDSLYIKRMYNERWACGCPVLAYNANFRFIRNPFGGVDFYKVNRENGDIFPIGRNLHKETILRFLMKFNISNSDWSIRYPRELSLTHIVNICGKVYEEHFSYSQLYYGSMIVKS